MFGRKASRDSAPGNKHGNLILTRVTRAKMFAQKRMPYLREVHHYEASRDCRGGQLLFRGRVASVSYVCELQ
jgi:hypothetical protein